MGTFSDGYNAFNESFSGLVSTDVGVKTGAIIEETRKATDALFENLRSLKSNQDISHLKGFVAEEWHATSFNMDAASKGIDSNVFTPNSTEFASPDIQTVNGEASWGLKYYKDAESSARAQSKSFAEHSKGEASRTSNSNDPIYFGQERIIPSDQLDAAKSWLQQKISKESITRPEEVARYQDTLNRLDDKVRYDGAESIRLSEKEARELAHLIKEDNLTSDSVRDNPKLRELQEELSVYEQIDSLSNILHESVRAGTTAAAISVIIKIAPEIAKIIEDYINTGQVDKEQFEKVGFLALKSGAEGFIRGYLTSAIVATCKAGYWGEVAKTVDPTFVAGSVIITMQVIENAIQLARGTITPYEMVQKTSKHIFVTTCALAMGSVTQSYIIPIPVVGYLVGSFVGSMVASFVYDSAESAIIALCVEKGYTFFGLVEQDYTLPDEVLLSVGADAFNYDTVDYDTFEHEAFSVEVFTESQYHAQEFEIRHLRRGVIGIGKIGYC